MAPAKSNKSVTIVLTEFHTKKLQAICQRTGLTKTAVIQRLIEEFDPFKKQEEGK